MDHDCGTDCSSCAGNCGSNELESAITFTDENGKDIEFQILDVVVLDERQFLIVVEADKVNSEDAEAIILEVITEDESEVFETVTEDELADKVFNKYLDQNKE